MENDKKAIESWTVRGSFLGTTATGVHYDYVEVVKKSALTAALKRERDLLERMESIRAKSYSWVIEQDSAYVLKPVHDSYRSIADNAIEANKKARGEK